MLKKMMSVVVLLFATTVQAEKITNVNDTKTLCAQSAVYFVQAEIKQFYEILMPHWRLPIEEIKNVVYQKNTLLKMHGERYGSFIGLDYLETDFSGSSLIQHIFAIKFDKKAVRYQCVFYKPKDYWIVNDISWEN